MRGKALLCLQCGEVLGELKCKLKCPRCGYFEDCSDGGTNLAQEIAFEKGESLQLVSCKNT